MFKLRCDFCEKYFYSSINLGIHVEICKKVNAPCEKCGKEYKPVKQFNNHLRTYKDVFFICDICKNVFKMKDSLLHCTRVHYPDLSDYKCPVCSNTCVNEKDLHIHTAQENISSTYINYKGSALLAVTIYIQGISPCAPSECVQTDSA